MALEEVMGAQGVGKVRHFMWRFLQGVVPCNVSLFRWKVKEDVICLLSDGKAKTINHVLWVCKMENQVWKRSELVGFYKQYNKMEFVEHVWYELM